MRITLYSLLAIVLLLIASVRAATAQGSPVAAFIPLGDLPGGGFFSQALDVTPGGSVTVGDSVSHIGAPGESEAFRWTRNGGMAGLGHPIPGYTQATGVSADGTVVVGFQSKDSGWEAFRWTSHDGRVPLAGIPFGFSSFATDVSADGTIVSGYLYGPNFWAFRWTAATGAVVLLPDYVGSVATGISANGDVIVGYTLDGGPTAFRWTEETGAVDLGDTPLGTRTPTALAVSADGSTVVGDLVIGNCVQAYRWTPIQGFRLLGHLPNRTCNSAYAASTDGAVVAGGSVIFDESGAAVGNEAFVWTERKGMKRLQDILAANVGFNLQGWTLGAVSAIASDERSVAIVGSGLNPRGLIEGWLAILPSVRRIGIDIKPGSARNPINLTSNGTIEIAILSQDQFDAPVRMDRSSLRFGRTGNENSLASCDARSIDVNDDHRDDLVCHFRTVSTDFACTDREGILTGETIDGNPLEGVVGRDLVDIKCR